VPGESAGMAQDSTSVGKGVQGLPTGRTAASVEFRVGRTDIQQESSDTEKSEPDAALAGAGRSRKR
jgi:hypothetical protein